MTAYIYINLKPFGSSSDFVKDFFEGLKGPISSEKNWGLSGVSCSLGLDYLEFRVCYNLPELKEGCEAQLYYHGESVNITLESSRNVFMYSSLLLHYIRQRLGTEIHNMMVSYYYNSFSLKPEGRE